MAHQKTVLGKLHHLILEYFSLDESKTLCFDLGMKFHTLPGDGQEGKIPHSITAIPLMKKSTSIR